MIVEEYIIGAPGWVIPAALIATVLGLAAIANYFKNGFSGWRSLALLLKLLAIAVLAICLVEPSGQGTRPRPRANLLPILVDASQSMSIRGSDDQKSDAERLQAMFATDPEWLVRADQTFDTRKYIFGARVQRVDSFREVKFEESSSQLATSLFSLGDQYGQRPVAGCLLFTDGNLTDESVTDWSQLGFPIYPVRDESLVAPADLRIDKVAVSETNFESAPITITATITGQRVESEEILVRLLDESGEVLEEQSHIFPADRLEISTQFRFSPLVAGVSFYSIQCVLAREPRAIEEQSSEVEATLQNNTRLVAVNRDHGPFPVLYVSGRPNWEFKYIRRAIEEDAEVRLVGLIRIAKRQPKFSFRDATVESSANPLFAGLGGDEEEAAEQLDEAVVIRLGVEDATELAGGFPKEAEDLFPFAAVVLDDVEAEFFTRDQLLLLRRFVASRGGAIMMLGGDDSLEKGGYDDTPLGELSPVYLPSRLKMDDVDRKQEWSENFSLSLTREGMLQPFLRLRETEAAELARLSSAPPLKVLNRVGGIKPGSAVLAMAEDATGSTAPALVAQPFGRGRSAALMVGDLWRWSLQRDMQLDDGPLPVNTQGASDNSEDPPQAWRQIVRWLVSDVPKRLEAEIEDGEAPGVMRLSVLVKDADFTPLDGARVEAEIQPPSGELVSVTLEPNVAEPGTYFTEYWPREVGGYRAKISAEGAEGTPVGIVELGWASDPTASEFEEIGTDVALLKSIAEATGGEVIALDDVATFIQRLESQPVPVSERWTFAVWHRSWVCAFALICLCGEWGIRRWKGLA